MEAWAVPPQRNVNDWFESWMMVVAHRWRRRWPDATRWLIANSANPDNEVEKAVEACARGYDEVSGEVDSHAEAVRHALDIAASIFSYVPRDWQLLPAVPSEPHEEVAVLLRRRAIERRHLTRPPRSRWSTKLWSRCRAGAVTVMKAAGAVLAAMSVLVAIRLLEVATAAVVLVGVALLPLLALMGLWRWWRCRLPRNGDRTAS